MAREPLITTRRDRSGAATPLLARRSATEHPRVQGTAPAPRSFPESRFSPDFSRVPAHGALFLNGPDPSPRPAPATPTPTPRPPACPTVIKVVQVERPTDRDFGKNGPITGWGGYSVMEVSDSSGRNWDGTAVHETLRNVKNTCGDPGRRACSNQSGEGGGGGSSFRVGEASSFIGLIDLPAARNRFYDLHIFADKTASLLHTQNKESCEVQCEQSYDCGGNRFGPTFVITYTMTRGSVPRSAGGSNAVTHVRVDKAAKAP